MIGKLKQIQGPPVIKNGEIEGDFTHFPVVDGQLCVFGISEEGSMRFVETARVVSIDDRNNGVVTFTCKDRCQYSIEKTGEGSMVMENGGAY